MGGPSFPDHFSAVAGGYARYRPRYPDALFAHLAQLAPGRAVAWDCATGSGQAALGLVPHFDWVVATDASAAQLAAADPHPRVEYRVAPAEASGLEDASAALVTVAQAAHWFDLPAFYAEVDRVLVQGGVVALWTYGLHRFGDAALDRSLRRYYADVVGPYWPAERGLVDEGYASLPFPYAPLPLPALEMRAEWPLEEVLGYVRTWSATARYRQAVGDDPVIELGHELARSWGDPAMARPLRWPLTLRVGRVA
jgi:SAM-dependent methyltransferase